MTKRPNTVADFDKEEGERTATALFGFMSKVRLYNAGARAVAIRIIEAEAKNETDPVEKKFFETAVEFIKAADAQQDAVMKATYGALANAEVPAVYRDGRDMRGNDV